MNPPTAVTCVFLNAFRGFRLPASLSKRNSTVRHEQNKTRWRHACLKMSDLTQFYVPPHVQYQLSAFGQKTLEQSFSSSKFTIYWSWCTAQVQTQLRPTGITVKSGLFCAVLSFNYSFSLTRSGRFDQMVRIEKGYVLSSIARVRLISSQTLQSEESEKIAGYCESYCRAANGLRSNLWDSSEANRVMDIAEGICYFSRWQ